MAVPAERILQSIPVLRGERVLLGADLATLYGVETRALVQAVKRNPKPFPADFWFQLSDGPWVDLKPHSGASSAWDFMEPPVPAKKPIGFRPKR